jgi:hypothetical protein
MRFEQIKNKYFGCFLIMYLIFEILTYHLFPSRVSRGPNTLGTDY